jgi:hypothetical protein
MTMAITAPRTVSRVYEALGAPRRALWGFSRPRAMARFVSWIWVWEAPRGVPQFAQDVHFPAFLQSQTGHFQDAPGLATKLGARDGAVLCGFCVVGFEGVGGG